MLFRLSNRRRTCKDTKEYAIGYKQGIADERKRIIEELEKEYKLAEEEKRRCASENQLQFDSAKGYSIGIWNALEIVRGDVNE